MRDIACSSSVSVGKCWDIALKYVTIDPVINKNFNTQLQDNLIYMYIWHWRFLQMKLNGFKAMARSPVSRL
jgi:hypothetical protein